MKLFGLFSEKGSHGDDEDEPSQQSDEEAVRDAAEKAFREQKKILDEQTKGKNLVISLYGDVSAGKSSTVNALTGKKLADVSSFSGSTTEIELHEYSHDVFIADTPGLNDISEENSRKTEDFVQDNADIVLFFFKATGVTKPEFEAFRGIAKTGKPIVAVINYIDIWYNGSELAEKESLETLVDQISSEIDRILADLGAPKATIPIVPISAKREINIDRLSAEVAGILEEKGKDLLYLKVTRYKEEKVRVWINGASITAAGIGAIPVPGADVVPLTALQVGLALKIAYVYDYEVSKEDVMQLLAATVTGTVGKQLYRAGLQLMKAAGWLGGPVGTSAVAALAAAISGAVTYGFGWACNVYYASDMAMDLGEVGDTYSSMFKTYFDKHGQGIAHEGPA